MRLFGAALTALTLWLALGNSAVAKVADEDPATAEMAPAVVDILARVAARPGERVRFVERRSNELLSEPISLEGYVSMDDQGILTRVVDQPFAEHATLDGDIATLQRDGRHRRVNLRRSGAAGAYLGALYALLRGDEAALRERFDLLIAGSEQAWQMVLTPTGARLERWLSRIVVSGAGADVESIRMERADGAWQHMHFEPGIP